MTQSPQSKIILNLKYFVILEQPERKFALSDDWYNLYIINPEETIFLEYSPSERKMRPWHEENGELLNGATMVLISIDDIEMPKFCQVKIRGTTKTYRFAKSITINGVRDALR